MLKIALRFNVSSSYLGRVCTILNVPRPEREYWTKVAVSKAPAKPVLPDARPGDETIWAPASPTASHGTEPGSYRAGPKPTKHADIGFSWTASLVPPETQRSKPPSDDPRPVS
jgi:hypothetical protein